MPSAAPPPPPPYEFDSGSLYIRRETAWHRVDTWPGIQAYHRIPGDYGSTWVPDEPAFRLVLPKPVLFGWMRFV